MAETEGIMQYNSSFRCIDKIKNFKFRVKLRPTKTSVIPLPQFDQDKGTNSSEVSSQHTTEENQDTEEYVFHWQEKKFSQQEAKKYSNIENCHTKLHEKYHSMVNEMSSSKTNGMKLFTYVDEDNYVVPLDSLNLVDDNINYMSLLGQRMRDLEIHSSTTRKNFKNIAKKKIINPEPSAEFKMENHYLQKNVQRMFIMAEFQNEIRVNNTGRTERMLCSMTYDVDNNVLQLTPSFSANLTPYHLDVGQDDERCDYHYWIEHVSSGISQEDIETEKQVLSKIVRHQIELRESHIESDFFSPPPQHLHVVVLAEILQGQGFEGDGVFVRYTTTLPPAWSSVNESSRTGVTHSSRVNDHLVAHFAHTFQLAFSVDLSQEQGAIMRTPDICFQVCSMDSWSRYRSQGYTYLTIPARPGCHTFRLPVWTPAGDRVQRMRQFFIGGGQEIEDATYVGVPALFKGKLLSRLGFQTIQNGELKVRLYVIHQSDLNTRPSDVDETLDTKRPDLDTINTTYLLGSINIVLDAFKRARERMIRAQQSLEVDD